MGYFFKALGKYFSISGRASRKELWMFLLFEFIFAIGACAVDFYLGTTYSVVNDPSNSLGTVTLIFFAFTFIPNQTLQIRRLHDANKSGFWWLISFIPLICIYPYCLMFFAESYPHPNKYGDVPENVRGYQPNVYVNINMNQAHDGRYETSYERYEEQAFDNQYSSTPTARHSVQVKRHSPAEKNINTTVYEKSKYTDLQAISIPEESTPQLTYLPEISTEELFTETGTSEASSISHSWITIAMSIAIVVGLILFIAYFVKSTHEQNAGSPIEKVEILDTKNAEDQIAEFLSDENAGYASDRFYSDTPLLRINMSDEEATFGVVRVYNTSYHLEVSGDCIEAEWYDYYTRVCVYPQKRGISYINFSNELNDETFQVMVVVD